MWYPGSGVVLIVLIPDLCHLSYFYDKQKKSQRSYFNLHNSVFGIKILNSGIILKTFQDLVVIIKFRDLQSVFVSLQVR